MAEWFAGFGAWSWVILGLVLMGLEALMPGVFLIWLGIAAILTGMVDGLLGLSWQASFLVFAALSIAAVLVGRKVSGAPEREETRNLNQRGAVLVGRTFTLDAPIERGEGRVRVDDSSWRIIGPDTPAGAHVKVVRVEGSTLVVEGA